MVNFKSIKESVAYRLVIYIFIFSSVITIASTGVQLYLEYERDLDNINKTANQIKNTHVPTIISSLWVYDLSMLETELKGIVLLPDVSYVGIHNNEKEILKVGKVMKDSRLSYEFPLLYKHRDKELILGSLDVEISLLAVYQRLWDRAVTIFISQALKTFLVSSFIYIIFHFIIGRHLKKMAKFAVSLKLQHLKDPLVLQRTLSSNNDKDELALVESAINTMRSNLINELETVEISQKELLQSEERFRSLVSNIPGIVYRCNVSFPWKAIYISEIAETITGYPINYFLNGEINFGQIIHHHDILKVTETISNNSSKGIPFEIEYRINTKNGEIRWLFEKGNVAYDTNNNPLWIDGVILDISGKKIIEQQLSEKDNLLRAIIENTTDAIFYKDAKRRYVLANTSTLNAIGREAHEVIGKTDFELFPKRSAEVINQIDSQVIDSKKSLLAEERLQTSTGDTYWQTNKTPFLDKEGHLIGLVGISRNVTDLKLAQKDKEELEKRLIQAQKMETIGTLAGGIAHDFNNILAAILGYAEIAIDSVPPGSDAINYLHKVMEAGCRAVGLVKQILAFSRQSAAEDIVLQPAIIIKEIIKILRPSLPSTIAITQKIDIATKSIFADPTQVHQIMMNLCTNAYHAMEESGGVLEIALKDRELSLEDLKGQPDVQPGSFVELSVKDSGTGIPLGIREKIFEPYFTTKEVGKGTGMGLAIVHGIIKKYGGFITSESTPEKGTVFKVYFPTIEKEAEPIIKSLETIQPGTERILFIDDEDILVDLGKAMLEHLGYEVTARTSSIEALTTFQNQPDKFDVVITDQTMPGITGSDLATRMLQIRPDLPIILCTGFSSLVSEEKARSIGIKGFAMKPIAKKDIATLLRKVLDEKKQTGLTRKVIKS